MKKVYLIYINSDMTEGKGQMVYEGNAFFDKQKALDYLDTLYGVMGYKKKWSDSPHSNGHCELKVIEVQ